MSSASRVYSKLKHDIRVGATFPIVAYQKTVSFDHGPLKILYPYGYCPFYPSCSEYTRLSILKDGVLKGSVKGVWRICRCHPFTKGGIDKP